MNRDHLIARLQQTRIDQLASSNKPQYPSPLKMAQNLGGSVVRNIHSVAQGNPLKVEPATAQARLNICKGCSFFDKAQERCIKCGCAMAVKTYLKAEKCPVGNW